jgi:probable F420-dependent oxidoreductase
VYTAPGTSDRLRFGYFPPLSARVGLSTLTQQVAREVALAEASGFSTCLIGEHHQQPFDTITSPLVVASFLAGCTTSIRLGTGLLVAPLYHPVHVAEDVAMLDIVSGGRAILGVGVGYQDGDFAAFGVPAAEREARLEESLAVVERCWSGETFSHAGRFWQLADVRIRPRPVQQPRPPLWLGAWSPAGVRRAARLGDAWLVDPIQGLSAVKEMAAVYRAEAARIGRRPRIVLMREGWVAKTHEQAVADYGPSVLAVYRYYWRNGAFSERHDPWLRDLRGEQDLTLEHFARDRFILGTPAECLEQIARWQHEVGIEELILTVRHPTGPDHDAVLRTIQLFGREVIPNAGAAVAPAGSGSA